MAAVRLAAVLVFALHVAGAQESSSGFTTSVVVTDPAGAPVSGALVDIGNGCSDPIGGETNAQGILIFDLNGGARYQLAATAPGFCPAGKAIDTLNQPAQTIAIQLEADACPNSCTPPCTPADSARPVKPAQSRLEPGQGRLSILVTDVRGTLIPEALIEADPSSDPPGPALKTDNNGRASLKLPAGPHTLLITARGFDRWAHQFNVQGASSRTIAAALQVRPNCEPVSITALTEPDLPLLALEPVLISQQPMQNLSPLPLQTAKKHW